MEIIAHRINTLEQLRKLPKEYGAEVDVKCDLNGRLYLQHDPAKDGESFEDFLKEYHHGTLILDIKDERIELRILPLLKKYNIFRYFFLDSSFPMIMKLTKELEEKKVAIRYSEYEEIETPLRMAGKADWVWVDTFTRNPMSSHDWALLKKNGYKICFVSPELQGQPEKKGTYLNELEKAGIELDAICTDVEL